MCLGVFKRRISINISWKDKNKKDKMINIDEFVYQETFMNEDVDVIR